MFGPDDPMTSWTPAHQQAWRQHRVVGRSPYIREFLGQFLRSRRARGMYQRLPIYVIILLVLRPFLNNESELLSTPAYYIESIPTVLGFIALFMVLALVLGITQGIARWKLFEGQFTTHEQDPTLFRGQKK